MEPEAYKRGVQDFYGRDFLVTPGVLIPRPETEMMIDAVLSLAGVPILPGVEAPGALIPSRAKILEVGTGSGCVAVSLKLGLPESEVYAVDISYDALAVAKKNAKKFNAKINFLKSDLMDGVRGDFDVICANLPYVDKNWDWLDRKSLSFEPELALYAEGGGLELIKKLIQQASGRCHFLILEADPCQHEKIKKYASDFGLKHIETRGFILSFQSMRQA